jgi:hypothetical protein
MLNLENSIFSAFCAACVILFCVAPPTEATPDPGTYFCILTTVTPAVGEEGVNTAETSPITFSGQGVGGVLTLANPINRDARYIAILTTVGESAESVAQRLADAITSSDPFRWWGPTVHTVADKRVNVLGSTILDLPGPNDGGWWVLGGTETGLGIPLPPTSLSAIYDPQRDKVLVSWVNPLGGYDSIALMINGNSSGPYPGESTHCTLPMIVDSHLGRDSMDLLMVGNRKHVPSNAGAITVDRLSQEEMINIPFTRNIAPNWSAWSDQDRVEAIQASTAISFEQGDRGDVVPEGQRKYPYPGDPGEKRFFQMIKIHKPGFNGGIWRKFLGLMPGHTYRIHARVNSFAMDSSESDWSFSIHAAYNDASGKDLTAEQFSGVTPLPNGNVGPQAGRIVGFGLGTNTQGEWKQYSTADAAPGKEITDIGLPEGVNTITVWIRCNGSTPDGVGFDWIKLEDITRSQR